MSAHRRIRKLERLVDPPWWAFAHRSHSSEYAAMQLWKSGPAAVPFLLDILENRQGERRRAVLAALKRIGPEDAEALPALIGAFKQAPAVPICRAIARLGPGGHAAAPAMVKTLPHADAQTQGAIVDALSAMAGAALPGFSAALTDRAIAWPVRQQAAEGMAALGSAARGAAGALLAGLQDRYCGVRHAAACAMDAAGFTCVEAVVEALGEDALQRLHLGTDDLRALMLVRRLHRDAPDELMAAVREMAEHERAGDAVWRRLTEALVCAPDELGGSHASPVGSEMLVFRLVTETDHRARMDYVSELGRRRAGWVVPLLSRLGSDPELDDSLRCACQEVAAGS